MQKKEIFIILQFCISNTVFGLKFLDNSNWSIVTFSDRGQFSMAVSSGTFEFRGAFEFNYHEGHINSKKNYTNFITYTHWSRFWSRKVFEGVHYHVLDLILKWDLGPPYFSLKRTKISDSNYFKVDQNCNWTRDLNFRSEIKPISVRICTLGSLWNRLNLRFWSISSRNRVDQNCIFESIPTRSTDSVLLNSFKHISGPKFRTLPK